MRCTYMLPLRWQSDDDIEELTAYLRRVAARAQLIVVDGSSDAIFSAHHAAWTFAEHVRPDADVRCLNGKVAGVVTGLRRAGHEAVVIADDDVRYDEEVLARVCTLLDRFDLVRPQNYFDPLPWHAAWDTARTLINRSFWRDFPGTLGLRRSVLERSGWYDGDVLFENLQCIRTVHAAGGREVAPLDLYVRRLPPRARRFWSQRVRQAYDDFALPGRMAVELSVLPFAVVSALAWGPSALASMVGAAIGLAEIGRRRADGRAVFPARAALFAPLWVAERAITSWLAVATRVVFGGVRYGDHRITRATAPVVAPKTHAAASPERRRADDGGRFERGRMIDHAENEHIAAER